MAQDNIPELQRIVWLSELARPDHTSDRPLMTSVHLRVTHVVPRVHTEVAEIGYGDMVYREFAVYCGLDPSNVRWDLFALGKRACVDSALVHGFLETGKEVRGVFQVLRNMKAPALDKEAAPLMLGIGEQVIRLCVEPIGSP